ncbi:MAG TPA: hypothetical protein VIQ31_05200 [Phormidium sp.]
MLQIITGDRTFFCLNSDRPTSKMQTCHQWKRLLPFRRNEILMYQDLRNKWFDGQIIAVRLHAQPTLHIEVMRPGL